MLAEIFGPDLLIVVLVVVVVLFGGAAIPRLARNLGSAKKEFEKGVKEGGTADGAAPDGAPAAQGETPAVQARNDAPGGSGQGPVTPR